MSKCHQCPLSQVGEAWCPGEIAPTICQGKESIYREMLQRYKTQGITLTVNTSVASPILQHNNNNNYVLDKKLSDSRLEICSLCEHFDAAGIRCDLCGCGLTAKTLNPNEVCPISRW